MLWLDLNPVQSVGKNTDDQHSIYCLSKDQPLTQRGNYSPNYLSLPLPKLFQVFCAPSADSDCAVMPSVENLLQRITATVKCYLHLNFHIMLNGVADTIYFTALSQVSCHKVFLMV